MPELRVSDEVFARLQELAVPFVDTPDSVLKRVLEIDGAGPTDAAMIGRARPGSILPLDEYKDLIPKVLKDLGGSASAKDVIDEVGRRLDHQLTSLDRETIKSGIVRWRNRAQWARLRLVEAGVLKKGSPSGIWELAR